MLKNKIKYILLFFVVVFICFFEFPYYIETPGGLDNLNNKVKVENGYKAKGSINLTYVSQVRATLPLMLYAKINPDWNILPKKEKNEVIDYESLMIREQIMMKQSYTSAIKFAYKEANKKVDIKREKCYVVYAYKDSKTDLKIGDMITSIDGKRIDRCDEISKYIRDKNEGDISTIVVENNNKEYKRNVEFIKIDDQTLIGVQVATEYVLETEPSYKFKFNNSEYGPSGGLMIALAVYNSLVEEDITGGKKIAGTGTLNSDGSVGEIGGIEYKLKGAVKKKADVFFAPAGENYDDAIKLKEKRKYKIDIVKVESFSDALNYLRENVMKK